jgi:hypothetical protein
MMAKYVEICSEINILLSKKRFILKPYKNGHRENKERIERMLKYKILTCVLCLLSHSVSKSIMLRNRRPKTRGLGDSVTRGPGDSGTRGLGDSGTRGLGSQ